MDGGEGEICGLDLGAAGHDGGALHFVAEFAQVSGPGVVDEGCFGGRGQAARLAVGGE